MENKYFGKIIDTHAHVYPDKIASKAVQAVGNFYNIEMNKNGSISCLIETGKEAGVSKYVIHSLATTTHQVQSINNFILSSAKENDCFIPFMTFHPDMSEKEMEEERDRVLPLGVKGVKLHPDFQKFYVDDENVYKIYRVCEGKLPILFHAGDYRYEYSAPARIAKIAKLFPDLTVISAHFGGYHRWSEVGVYQGLDNVYFDTSSSFFMISYDEAKEIIDRLGVDKFMFGTDYPMWQAKDEVQHILNMNLSDEDNEKIFYKNAERVLQL